MSAPGREWTPNRRTTCALGLSLVLVTLPFIEMLLGLKTGMYNDLNGYHPPRYVAVWRNIFRGDSPFWWKTILGGHNTLGAGQSAPFYLPNIVFGWFYPPTAYRIWFFFHLWLMAAGWFAWSKRRWGSNGAAVVSALVGSLNGVLVSHVIDTVFTAPLALLPWTLLLLDLVLERRRAAPAVGLALLIAGIALTGHPQLLWITLVTIAVIAAFSAIGSPGAVRALIRVAGSSVLGVALSAMCLIPQMVFSRTSVRPKLDKAAAFQYAEEPRHLWTLIAPNIMGGSNSAFGWHTPWLAGTQQPEQINYLGIIGLALAIIGAVVLRRDRRVWAFGALALFALLSGLGDHTPFGSLVFDVVPLANRFRIWSRNILIVNLVVASLAGAGVSELLRRPRRWLQPLAISVVVLAIVMAVLPALTDLGGAMVRGREGVVARFLPVFFLLGALLACAVIVHNRRLGIALLIVACTLDLGSFAFAGLWRGQGSTPAQAEQIWSKDGPFFGKPIDQPDGLDRWVSDVADSSTLWPAVLPSAGPTVNGYDSLLQADYATTIGGMAYNGYLNNDIMWQGSWMPDVMRVTTLLASPYAAAPSPGWTPTTAYPGFQLWSYTPRLAESYLVGASRVTSLDDARNGIYNPTTDLQNFAFVDVSTIDPRDVPSFASLTEPGSSGTVTDGAMGEGGYGRWTVTAGRPSVFVTSWAWTKGWEASVDGKPVPVARTNALVLGVPVPSGTHVVRLWFTPPGWNAGKWISIAAGVVALLLLALDNRRLLGGSRISGLLAGRFSFAKRPVTPKA